MDVTHVTTQRKTAGGGIKGGCKGCFDLLDLHEARLQLEAAVREFTRRAGPWARQRERRSRKKAVANAAGSESQIEEQP